MKKITLILILSLTTAATQAQSYQITFAGAGAATTVDSVKVQNLTQCTDTLLGGRDTLLLDPAVGIAGSGKVINNLNVFPNPMTGDCSIDFETAFPGKTTISVYDAQGKRILQTQEILTAGSHKYRLSGIGAGIYNLNITSEKFSCTARLISLNNGNSMAAIKHIESSSFAGKQSITSVSAKTGNIKGGKTVMMQYNAGDLLKITGKSGVYRTVFMLVATQNQTVTFNFIPCTDAQNNNYSTVETGTQTWMAENLNAGIKTDYSNEQTDDGITEKYCYNNDDANCTTYGAFYQWAEMVQYYNGATNTASWNPAPSGNVQGICPAGWHLPSNDEWCILENYLETGLNPSCSNTGWLGIHAGGDMKETCTSLWNTPNIGASNISGFSALPAGYRGEAGFTSNIGNGDSWWAASEESPSVGKARGIENGKADICNYGSGKKNGFSVRCIKDCPAPSAPDSAVHVSSGLQITWNWNTVQGATGYKYNTLNDYSTATDNGTDTTYTQTNLSCNTAYTLYVWAYNSCGNSGVTALTQSTTGIPVNGLIAYYPFNGDASDSSGNSNNGTVYGASLTADRFGNPNAAYSFDGIDDYILVANSSSFPQTAITISFWLNRNNQAVTGNENYISKEKAFQTYLYNSPKMSSGLWKGTPGVWSDYQSSSSIPFDSNWLFYSFTYDNATHIANTYINGVLDSTLVDSDPNSIVRTSSSPMYIGRNGSANVYYIKGFMDDIRIYNRALTDKEVLQLYQGCNP